MVTVLKDVSNLGRSRNNQSMVSGQSDYPSRLKNKKGIFLNFRFMYFNIQLMFI